MVEKGQFRLGKKKRTAPVTYVSEKIPAIKPKGRKKLVETYSVFGSTAETARRQNFRESSWG